MRTSKVVKTILTVGSMLLSAGTFANWIDEAKPLTKCQEDFHVCVSETQDSLTKYMQSVANKQVAPFDMVKLQSHLLLLKNKNNDLAVSLKDAGEIVQLEKIIVKYANCSAKEDKAQCIQEIDGLLHAAAENYLKKDYITQILNSTLVKVATGVIEHFFSEKLELCKKNVKSAETHVNSFTKTNNQKIKNHYGEIAKIVSDNFNNNEKLANDTNKNIEEFFKLLDEESDLNIAYMKVSIVLFNLIEKSNTLTSEERDQLQTQVQEAFSLLSKKAEDLQNPALTNATLPAPIVLENISLNNVCNNQTILEEIRNSTQWYETFKILNGGDLCVNI